MLDKAEIQQLDFNSLPGEAGEPSAAGLNILILNTHLPIFPGGGGVEYLTTKHIASLADRVGLVSMAHTRDDLNKTQGLVDAGVQLYLWHSPHLDASEMPRPKAPLIRSLYQRYRDFADAVSAGPSRPIDTMVIDRCYRNMSASLIHALSEQPWQVLSVIESSGAKMIDYTPRQLVSILVMHDIRSVVYQRRAQASASFWERRRLLRQARRYYAFERKYSQRYDLVTTVSREDADWVRKHYRPQRVITVPLPVDAQYFEPGALEQEVSGRIVFTGLMNHPPNADAAIYFAREVLPKIRAIVPHAEFFIVGRHPPAEVQDLERLPGVHVTGGVPDIRPYLATAEVVVVPLRYGSGARQKILEAWCMEKCVVATTVGAEGLEYQDGVNLAIADDSASMAATVARALGDREFRNRFRIAGRSVAVSAHDPRGIASDYYRQIQTVVAEKCESAAPMRVALDMRWMIPGMAGGLENLARSFMTHLIGLDRFNRYTAILPARCRYDFDLRSNPNINVVSKDSWANHAMQLRWRALRVLYAKLRLDFWESPEVLKLRFARSLDADIVYSFPGYIHPDVYPLRHVLMVPDIQHEYFPEFFSEAALAERRRLYGDSILRADHICAISEFTRQTLIDRLGVAPDKVTTIHLAADPAFSIAAEPEADSRVLGAYGLQRGEYLYFPAHTWHHKNHRTAIETLRILRDKYGLTLPLVCTGGSREAQPEIEQQIEAYGLQNQVCFLGYCPQNDIPAMYRGAAGLLYPSLFEGFGMPALEAMACGCPVVCSNTTSLPEIAGDAALLCEPLDAEAFADAVYRLLQERELREELRQRGVTQAARFSWQRHTLETVAVFYRLHRQIKTL